MRPIAGCEWYVPRKDATVKDPSNRFLSHLCVLAKDKQGWSHLCKGITASYREEHFYYKPRLDLERLGGIAGGKWVVFSGHPGSTLADCLWEEPKLAYRAADFSSAEGVLRPDWREVLVREVNRHCELFGKDNFYLEIQRLDRENLPAVEVLAECLRWVGRELGVPRVATPDAHYPSPEDAPDHRVLLCVGMRTTLKEVGRKADAGEDVGFSAFFRSNKYYIPSAEEMAESHLPDELASAEEIARRCQEYSLSSQPLLPQADLPGGVSPDEYLRQLCRDGWVKKIIPQVPPEGREVYTDRVKMELGVLEEIGLSPYFLVVRDFVRYAREGLGCLVGPRGSAGGCLVSYLIGLTDFDPVRFDLDFDRFINRGRYQPGRILLPDIDMDFPTSRREEVIAYCRDKYGHDRVLPLATFGRMQGRSAMSDVLRALGSASFEEAKRITAGIPNESQIADELQQMGDDASIIRWSLEHRPHLFRDWCEVGEGGELAGPLSREFGQAMRLEGLKRSMGTHASGLVICPCEVDGVAPVAVDKNSKQPLIAIDMRDAEDLGLVKFDILGLGTLDRLQTALNVVRTGKAS